MCGEEGRRIEGGRGARVGEGAIKWGREGDVEWRVGVSSDFGVCIVVGCGEFADRIDSLSATRSAWEGTPPAAAELSTMAGDKSSIWDRLPKSCAETCSVGTPAGSTSVMLDGRLVGSSSEIDLRIRGPQGPAGDVNVGVVVRRPSN